MNDSDNNLASNTIHLTERFNQALGADIEYRANADNKERFGALAEIENVRDNLDASLAKHRAIIKFLQRHSRVLKLPSAPTPRHYSTLTGKNTDVSLKVAFERR